MTLAIMQPYFFPYLGYMALLKQSDNFILLDTVQFRRHSWIERNKILNQSGGELLIKVPLVKHSRETLIKDIKINYQQDWVSKLMAQLVIYKKAPRYRIIRELIGDSIAKQFESLTQLNKHTLSEISIYLNLEPTISIWSEMDIPIEQPKAPDEWALNICTALSSNSYINPKGGMTFFNPQKYMKQKVDLKFIEYCNTPYKQLNNEFVENLSVIDALMFNESEEVSSMLENIIWHIGKPTQ